MNVKSRQSIIHVLHPLNSTHPIITLHHEKRVTPLTPLTPKMEAPHGKMEPSYGKIEAPHEKMEPLFFRREPPRSRREPLFDKTASNHTKTKQYGDKKTKFNRKGLICETDNVPKLRKMGTVQKASCK